MASCKMQELTGEGGGGGITGCACALMLGSPVSMRTTANNGVSSRRYIANVNAKITEGARTRVQEPRQLGLLLLMQADSQAARATWGERLQDE